MRNSKRLWFVGLMVFVLIAGIADSILWQRAERQLQTSFNDLCDQLRSNGFAITPSAPRKGGWPFAAAFTVDDFNAHGANGVSWRSDHIKASVSLFSPWKVTLDLRGPHRLSLPGLPAIALKADSLTAGLPFVIGQSATLNGRAVMVSADDRPLLSIAELTGTASREKTELSMSARAEILEWVQDNKLTAAFGPRLSSVSADAALTLPPSLGDAGTLADWRERHGRLLARRLAFGWGPLGFDGQFTVTLDQNLQPVLDGTGKFIGYPSALAAMANAGVITGNTALAARAALGLLGDASDGSSPQVTLPFSVQNGIVSLAGFPLFRVAK